uniref:Uncharacterized protein n=1 Tax=Aegilops tauschii subsp. strangulata TaxID=200361 RepID=A0A453IC21_AEGTS
CRWFRWPSPARGLCSSPHSGPAEGMGSDGTGARRRLPPANGVSKEGAPLPLPQPVPPRLLTLPTVLTIGRVAAVPFLISSKRQLSFALLFSNLVHTLQLGTCCTRSMQV